MKLLLQRGADPAAKTHIDDCVTPLEEARILGRRQAVAFLEQTLDGSG